MLSTFLRAARRARAVAPPRAVVSRAAAAAAALAAAAASAARCDDGAAEGDGADEGAGGASAFPGDFGSREHELSLGVDPAEGLSLVVQSSVGGGGRDGGSAGVQMQFAPAGVQTYVIVADGREPSLQLVFAPGQEGRTAKLVVGARPAPGVSVDAEVLATSAGALAHVKGGAKLASDDALLTLAATVPLGGGANTLAELSYHQALAPGATAGGSLAAAFAPGLARVAGLQWAVFGSLTNTRGDSALLGKAALVPRQEGPPARGLSLTAWHRATRALELSTTLGVTLAPGGVAGEPAAGLGATESTCGIGARLTFAGAGGLNPVLGAHVSERTAGVSLTVPFAGLGSSTFVRSTASVVANHATRDFKIGANVEFYY